METIQYKGHVITVHRLSATERGYIVRDAYTNRWVGDTDSLEDAKAIVNGMLEDMHRANDGPFTN